METLRGHIECLEQETLEICRMVNLDHTGSSSENIPSWAQDIIEDIASRNFPNQEDGFKTKENEYGDTPKEKEEVSLQKVLDEVDPHPNA